MRRFLISLILAAGLLAPALAPSPTQAAVALATTEKPDLVILDMNMPGQTGWEAVRAIKAAADTGNIPVIALSTHATAGDKDEAHEAGCDRYLEKPVTPDQLLDAVRALLG